MMLKEKNLYETGKAPRTRAEALLVARKPGSVQAPDLGSLMERNLLDIQATWVPLKVSAKHPHVPTFLGEGR